MTMRRIAASGGIFLAGFMLAGCATATIEDAVPAGALTQSHVESPAIQADNMPQDARNIQTARVDSNVAPADAYPNLNVAPATAAPQISEEKKAADRAELRAHQTQIAAEARGNALSNDADALRRLADRQIEETLKEIEGR